MPKFFQRRSGQPVLFYTLLGATFTVVAFAAMLNPLLASSMGGGPQVGQVVPQDILAPRTVTFSSEVLTEQKRALAEQDVPRIYTSPDLGVARQQMERLRNALAYINSVRADSYASIPQKQEDLAALEDLHLSQEMGTRILIFSDARWQAVQQNAVSVLEEVMRQPIRAENLEAVRNTVPNNASLSLSEEQTMVVAELAAAFVAPNSVYSESLTASARRKAREAVQPVQRTFISGETVVTRGTVLDSAEAEALLEMGLVEAPHTAQDSISALTLVFLMLAFVLLYLHRSPPLNDPTRSLALITLLFLAFLWGGRLLIPGHIVLPYAFPVAGFGMLVAALFSAPLAMVTSLPLSVMMAFGMPNALDLTLYYMLTSLFGVLALGSARRMVDFFWSGIVVMLAGAAVVVMYRLPMPTTDWIGLMTLSAAAAFNGMAAASLTLLLQFFLAQFLGTTTPMQLMELTRPDHPLLQLILHEAPGTYQHSLQVANLAEQAAERIGADPLLTRVGALYHDAGKALNPYYFIENQLPGFNNPHEALDPAASSAIIIRHIEDGLELARKYRLPRRLSAFVSEHHGTMITRYQYVNAVKENGGDESLVDPDKFRYPGLRPQSKETAILMLADGCEARVRAEKPREETELRSVIKNVIDNRVAWGQLDDTDLTLKDLDRIADSFTITLRGIYHPRVMYPKLEAATQPEPVLASTAVITRPRSENPPSVP